MSELVGKSSYNHLGVWLGEGGKEREEALVFGAESECADPARLRPATNALIAPPPAYFTINYINLILSHVGITYETGLSTTIFRLRKVRFVKAQNRYFNPTQLRQTHKCKSQYICVRDFRKS